MKAYFPKNIKWIDRNPNPNWFNVSCTSKFPWTLAKRGGVTSLSEAPRAALRWRPIVDKTQSNYKWQKRKKKRERQKYVFENARYLQIFGWIPHLILPPRRHCIPRRRNLTDCWSKLKRQRVRWVKSQQKMPDLNLPLNYHDNWVLQDAHFIST